MKWKRNFRQSFFSGTLVIHDAQWDDSAADLVEWALLSNCLKSIDFHHCSLNSFPQNLMYCKRLETLNLRGNPLNNLGGSTDYDETKVMSFLRNETILSKDLKLVFIGEASVGKTTLMRKLVNSTEGLETNISTDGVDMGDLLLSGFHFSCWDFGGQALYRYVHQLFLSEKCLALLLFDLRTPENDVIPHLHFWFQSLILRSPSSICLLVGTHSSSFSSSVAEERCRRVFEPLETLYRTVLKGMITVDAISNHNISSLKYSIVKFAQDMVCASFSI
jgi:hypothetical protein